MTDNRFEQDMAAMKAMSPEDSIKHLINMLDDPRMPELLKELDEVGLDLKAILVNAHESGMSIESEELLRVRDKLLSLLGVRMAIENMFEEFSKEIPIDPRSATYAFSLGIECAGYAPEWGRGMFKKLRDEEIEIGGESALSTSENMIRSVLSRLPVAIKQEEPDADN